MAKLSSSPKLACLALFLLIVVSAPSAMGRVRSISEAAAEERAEVVMEAVAKEVAKEELMNAYYKYNQEIGATTRSNSQQHLKQVVEQKPLKKCSLVGFPCDQDSDCCFGLTCRYVPSPFYNACSLI